MSATNNFSTIMYISLMAIIVVFSLSNIYFAILYYIFIIVSSTRVNINPRRRMLKKSVNNAKSFFRSSFLGKK